MTSITFPGRAGGAEIEINLNDFSESIREALTLHGLQQKVADAAANAQKNEWSVDQTRAACMGVLEALRAGQWGKRSGGGPRAATEDDFVTNRLVAKMRAKAKANNASVDEAAFKRAAEAALLSEKHAALVESIRAEYRAKQAARAMDLSDLLD